MPAAAPARAFDATIRVLDCHRCGAPLTVVPDDGAVTCDYCEAVHQFAPRTENTNADASGPSTDRLTWVRAQLADPNRVSPFDPDANYLPELGEFEGKRWSPRQFRDKPLPAFRREWTKAVDAVRGGDTSEAARYRVYWLADKLAQVHEFLAAAAKLENDDATQAQELLRWRAVLETGATLLADTDHEYVLRCELARAAAKTGDIDAAKQWLAPLDPEPDVVDLDTEWRIARATLAATENDSETILELLGDDFADVPLCGDRNRRTGAVLRVHALELAGRDADARRAYRNAGSAIGFAKIWSELSILGFAPKFHARQRKTARWVILGVLAMVVGGIALLVWRLV